MYKKILLAVFLGAVLFSACKKQTEEYPSAVINDYMPLQTGKYIIYQLDSIRYGLTLVPIKTSYQVKFQVDSPVTDNLGRTAYRIYRYIRNDATVPWVEDDTYMAINTGNSLEFVENNLRFVKLKLPIVQDYTWKGNSFINTTTDTTEFNFTPLGDWDYTYDSLNTSIILNGVSFDNVIKVSQKDEVLGNPNDLSVYSEINYSAEYYAKGIGMVYKRIFYSQYQPPINGYAGYYTDNSAGATFTMIEHN